MTIYTRFGTPIKLVKPIDETTGYVNVVMAEIDNPDETFEFHISDLKADNGINEIYEASHLLELVTYYEQRYRYAYVCRWILKSDRCALESARDDYWHICGLYEELGYDRAG